MKTGSRWSGAALWAGIVVTFFAGCASVPKVEMTKETAARVKRVALLGVVEPAQVEVANLGGAASAFGIIGGLVQGASNASNAKEFTALVKEQNVSFGDALLAAMEQSLRASGYDVVQARDQRPKLSADGKSDDFSAVQADADALLALGFGVFGYVSEPMSLRYEPWVVIKARMVDAKTKQDLYFKTFVVGWKMKIENAVVLPAPEEFRYKSFDEVKSRAAHAVTGLVRCGDLVAQQIGKDLVAR